MFKIAILLRVIDIINTSWHPLQASCWNLNPLSKKNNSEKYNTLLIRLSYKHQSLQKRQFYHNIPFIIYAKLIYYRYFQVVQTSLFSYKYIVVVLIFIFIKNRLNEYCNVMKCQCFFQRQWIVWINFDFCITIRNNKRNTIFNYCKICNSVGNEIISFGAEINHFSSR